jgi:hypothetical protein
MLFWLVYMETYRIDFVTALVVSCLNKHHHIHYHRHHYHHYYYHYHYHHHHHHYPHYYYRHYHHHQDADDVEEFLEGIETATVLDDLLIDASYGFSKEWKAQILLQAILCIGGSMISTITGLADRYSGPLRSLALALVNEEETDGVLQSNPNALMITLVQCLGHELGYLNIVLDILLRRGIITPTAAAEYACSSSVMSTILTNYWHHMNIEVTVDRTLDIVRAATANRRELGLDMIMDETADLSTLISQPKEIVSVSTSIEAVWRKFVSFLLHIFKVNMIPIIPQCIYR